MSELKLLNCPFCGGEARNESCGNYWVKCAKCGSRGSVKNTEKEAINQWNTRTPMANILEKLEESQERYDDVAFMEMNTNGHALDFEYAHGKKDGVQEAINIVKQEIKQEKIETR